MKNEWKHEKNAYRQNKSHKASPRHHLKCHGELDIKWDETGRATELVCTGCGWSWSRETTNTVNT